MRRCVVILLLLAASLMGAPTRAGASGCETGWGSLPRAADGDAMSGPITDVRVGTHPCFDRLVLQVNGPRPGVRVQYVDVVTNDPTGDPVVVPGGARLLVTVFSPEEIRVPSPRTTGFPVFRSLVFAGSFEGVTSYGLGVRARLPFRVLVLDNPTRVVIDVARSWLP